MFLQFSGNTTEGMIRPEVGYDTLQGKRTAPTGYTGILTERSKPFSGLFVYLLKHLNFSECRVPG